MTQWPDRTVAIPFIIVLNLTGRKKDGMKVEFMQFCGNLIFFTLFIGINAGPANPVLLRLCFERSQSRGQASLTSFYEKLIFVSLNFYREPVCNNNNLH